MIKFLVGLLVLLGIAVAVQVIRKLRGGSFFPPPKTIDGKEEPQSLRGLAERNRKDKAAKPPN
jgi:hypothetical protein